MNNSINAKYYDGISSEEKQIIILFDDSMKEFRFETENGNLFVWNLKDLQFEIYGNFLEIKNKNCLDSTLKIEDNKFSRKFYQAMKKNKHVGIHRRLLNLNFSKIILITILVIGVISSIYFYVLPPIAEKSATLLPESFDNQIGEIAMEAYMDGYIHEGAIDTEKTKYLQKHYYLLLTEKTKTAAIKDLIENKPVFVVGAGPSLLSCIPILKKYKKITKIVADGAVQALIENSLRPNIVVTDLDGDVNALKKTGRTNTIMVVHAHGDNSDKLHLVKNFKNCIGTTQTKPIGKIQNFGGFTDGDRCVFLANHFKDKKIILLGMDFGTTIGKYSKPRVINRNIKIAKLRCGKKLLEWLAQKSGSELYSTTAMKGFTKIKYREIDNIITSKNAF